MSLIPFSQATDIGLHFNLTEGQSLSPLYQAAYGKFFSPLKAVLSRSFLRRWDKAVIMAELEAQLDMFEKAMGRLPCFLDGHQHVHQFPIIREAILTVYAQRLRQQGAYIRLALPKISSFKQLKQLVIILSGAKTFARELERLSIPHNSSFSGSYGFRQASHYRDSFQKFLMESADGGLVMCHPGLSGEATSDPIAGARLAEYKYLASDQFLLDCAQKGVKIGQFTEQMPF